MVCRTAVSIAAWRARFTDSFSVIPFSTSTNSVSLATNLKTSWDTATLSIVLVTKTSNNMRPVDTDTVRKDTITVSWRYSLELPIPRYLAP